VCFFFFFQIFAYFLFSSSFFFSVAAHYYAATGSTYYQNMALRGLAYWTYYVDFDGCPASYESGQSKSSDRGG
jgi:hypothetical protein